MDKVCVMPLLGSLSHRKGATTAASSVDLLVVIPATTSSFSAELSSRACIEMTCYRCFHFLLFSFFFFLFSFNLCKLTKLVLQCCQGCVV